MLEALRKHKLYLRPEKCSFEKETVEYLGTIVGRGEVRMDPTKVDTVTGWLVPRCKRDMQSFLGFCSSTDQTHWFGLLGMGRRAAEGL